MSDDDLTWQHISSRYEEAGLVPESFNVLVKEVRGLGLNMELLDAEDEE